MVEITLFEQLEYLVNMLVSTPLLLFLLFLTAIIIALLLAYTKKQIEVTEKAIKGTVVLIIVLIFFVYHTSIIKLLDGFIENVITLIYFPNLVVYILILLASNIILITTFIKKKGYSKKIPSIANAICIDTIALIFLQEILNGNIDIYQEITINSEKELLILLQLTTEIFFLYLLATLLIYITFKLIKLKDKNVRKKVLSSVKNLKKTDNKNYKVDKEDKLVRKEVIDFDEKKDE